MTLNLTVAWSKAIYQSADYRLLDWTTGQVSDFHTQKILLVNTFSWSATVCFAGVGRTQEIDVAEWLSRQTAAIGMLDSFDTLIERLRTAADWLERVPRERRRHTFTIGAFVEHRPLVAVVSNHETVNGPPAPIPTDRLGVSIFRPTHPFAFVGGRRNAVSRPERKGLEILAEQGPTADRMRDALLRINQNAAQRDKLVSPLCYTSHLTVTGHGDGRAHGIESPPLSPIGLDEVDGVLRDLLNKQFPRGWKRVGNVAFARSEPTDEFHAVQLREKPDDPQAHSNYGAYLQDKKNDLDGAEREYRIALDLDPNYVNALGNLGNLLWDRGELLQARELYDRGLSVAPGNEHVSWNYARRLLFQANGRPLARDIAETGIAKNPHSGRLLLLRAEISFLDEDAAGALAFAQRARNEGFDQKIVETFYACALHKSGAPLGECIAAYRTALALDTQNANLRLNLAQLLFLKEEILEGRKHLEEAHRLGLDASAELEEQFYRLAYTESHPRDALKRVKELVGAGTRLRWDISQNIAAISHKDPTRAELLEMTAAVMRGDIAVELEELIMRWRSLAGS